MYYKTLHYITIYYTTMHYTTIHNSTPNIMIEKIRFLQQRGLHGEPLLRDGAHEEERPQRSSTEREDLRYDSGVPPQEWMAGSGMTFNVAERNLYGDF